MKLIKWILISFTAGMFVYWPPLVFSQDGIITPFRWMVERSRPAPQKWPVKRGESIYFQPQFFDYGVPARLATATHIDLFYRPSGSTSLPHCIPGSLMATTGMVSFTWTPTNELPSVNYSCEVIISSVTGTMNRCDFTIQMEENIGYRVGTNTTKTWDIIDLAVCRFLNYGYSPWPDYAWVTNYVGAHGGGFVNWTDIQEKPNLVTKNEFDSGISGLSNYVQSVADYITNNLTFGGGAGSGTTTNILIVTNVSIGGSVTNILIGGTNINLTTNIIEQNTYTTNVNLNLTTNITFDNRTNWNINVSTNFTVNNSTNVIQNTVTNLTIQNIATNTTNTYTAVDDSKWSTNQPIVAALIWTNSGVNSTVTNAGLITATINTNSGTGSGGVTNHAQLSGVVGNGSNHLSAAEVARIPPDYTNVTIQGSYRHNGTNGFWAPVYERYDTGLSTVWTHATNLYSSGISTQRWIVPAGVEQVYVSAWGAGGGGAANGLGGDGGFAHTVVNVTAGDTVSVAVATSGQGFGSTNINTLGGWPGGGNGGGGTNVTTRGGGGGGCSIVWHNSIIVAVAAGGGGGNPINASSPGGAGGGLVGGSGAGSTGTLPTGGNQNGGGSGGLGLTYLGANGTFLSGGSGTSVVASVTGSSGGGGSGYYGGGGGSYQTSAGQSGGGGSCWVAPTDLYGYICRAKNADDPDYVVPWGAGGSTSASGADGGVVLKWFYVIP